MKNWRWFAWAGIAAALLFSAIRLLPANQPTATPVQLACRPSAPAIAAERSNDPVLLLFGNSLLFDHGWSVPGYFPVNCARQGLTARDGQGSLALLPDVAPTAVIIAFGSVEAFRATERKSAVASGPFDEALRGVVEHLAERWPDAALLVSNVPATYGLGQADVLALNASITQAITPLDSSARLLDLDKALAGQQARDVSYDGVHLTPFAYDLWTKAIRDVLGDR